MSIKAYTGIMGSGKTYEVVSEVIFNALKQGRRVVSNIAGLNYEAFVDLLVEEGTPAEKIGQLVPVEHEQVKDPLFWRTDKCNEEGTETIIQPGDLVVLDEIWRFWDGFSPKDSDGKKMPDRVKNFFRMHRHMAHPTTGVTCDLAIICQDIMDCHRGLRSVVEETYLMTKLTIIGSSKRYRVDIFQRASVRGRPSKSLQRSYNPRYFVLYSSHSQKKEGDADAREVNIDSRGNILTGTLFKVVLPLLIPLFGLAVWAIWGFFHPAQLEKDKATKDGKPAEVVHAAAGEKSGPAAPDVSEWRVTGSYSVGGVTRVVLHDGNFPRFIVSPPVMKQTPVSLEVQLPDGSFATSWSGASRPSLIPHAGSMQ